MGFCLARKHCRPWGELGKNGVANRSRSANSSSGNLERGAPSRSAAPSTTISPRIKEVRRSAKQLAQPLNPRGLCFGALAARAAPRCDTELIEPASRSFRV